MPGRRLHDPSPGHRRQLVVAIGCGVALAAAGVAAAAWGAPTSAPAAAHGGSVGGTGAPAVGTITGTVTRSVPLSWSSVAAATGYVVRRYDAVTGLVQVVGGTCAGTLTTTSCVDSTLAGLSW